MTKKTLLAIVELGGYPDFRNLYRQYGYQVVIESSIRKALARLKKKDIDVVVAEFNYQHTFRDRLSNLESIIAAVQKFESLKMIVLYEREFDHYLDKLRQQYQFSAEIAFPVNQEKMETVLTDLQLN